VGGGGSVVGCVEGLLEGGEELEPAFERDRWMLWCAQSSGGDRAGVG
jgi:hypothetical protein